MPSNLGSNSTDNRLLTVYIENVETSLLALMLVVRSKLLK